MGVGGCDVVWLGVGCLKGWERGVAMGPISAVAGRTTRVQVWQRREHKRGAQLVNVKEQQHGTAVEARADESDTGCQDAKRDEDVREQLVQGVVLKSKEICGVEDASGKDKLQHTHQQQGPPHEEHSVRVDFLQLGVVVSWARFLQLVEDTFRPPTRGRSGRHGRRGAG